MLNKFHIKCLLITCSNTTVLVLKKTSKNSKNVKELSIGNITGESTLNVCMCSKILFVCVCSLPRIIEKLEWFKMFDFYIFYQILFKCISNKL